MATVKKEKSLSSPISVSAPSGYTRSNTGKGTSVSAPIGYKGNNSSSGSSGGSSSGFRDYSLSGKTWNPNAPKYTGGNAELDAYIAQKSKEYFDARAKGDATGMAAANNAANQARNYFGYAAENAQEDINKFAAGSGGGVGGGGGSTGGSGGAGALFPQFSYQGAPQYVSQWDSIIKDLAGQILNREPFEYNYLEDPNYIALKDMYTREGDRAMQDTMGEAAARTGGLASSYAVSAANQANNYFMSQLGDRIPELQQIAYDAYMAGIEGKRNDLAMILGLENMDYGKFSDSLSQWNADRNFNYGAWRDQVSDQRYEDDLQKYENELQYEKDLSMAEMMAGVGDFSGFASLWGMSDDQVQMLVNAYSKDQQTSESQAARELADWYAQYGDFSKLKDLGVDVSYLVNSQYKSSGGSGSSGTGGSRGVSSSSGKSSPGSFDIYQSMYDSGIRSEGDAYAYLLSNGYNTTQSGKLAGYFMQWMEGIENEDQDNLTVDMQSVLNLGYGPIDETSLENLIEKGEVEEYIEGGKLKFRRTGVSGTGGGSTLQGSFGLFGR